ncbi:hypothetical protein C8R45DRAFT_1110736 [Mycena sanguinolenta]|nr:hypothetical protein C8R45DRAFT_1110736 [Mycena sanguinolenta]
MAGGPNEYKVLYDFIRIDSKLAAFVDGGSREDALALDSSRYAFCGRVLARHSVESFGSRMIHLRVSIRAAFPIDVSGAILLAIALYISIDATTPCPSNTSRSQSRPRSRDIPPIFSPVLSDSVATHVYAREASISRASEPSSSSAVPACSYVALQVHPTQLPETLRSPPSARAHSDISVVLMDAWGISYTQPPLPERAVCAPCVSDSKMGAACAELYATPTRTHTRAVSSSRGPAAFCVGTPGRERAGELVTVPHRQAATMLILASSTSLLAGARGVHRCCVPPNAKEETGFAYRVIRSTKQRTRLAFASPHAPPPPSPSAACASRAGSFDIPSPLDVVVLSMSSVCPLHRIA